MHYLDPEYLLTKKIKQGVEEVDPLFTNLLSWITNTYKVTPLNIIFVVTDYGEGDDSISLNVIFEHHEEAGVFNVEDKWWEYDSQKQKAIRDQFSKDVTDLTGSSNKSLVKPSEKNLQLLQEVDLEKLHVAFSSFSPEAREEANQQISENILTYTVQQLNNPDLWRLFPFGGSCVFFVYTDEQKQKYLDDGFRKKWSCLYLELLKPHDEFNYFNEDNFQIWIDSKQNLDENYEGNFFFYLK